MKRCKIWLTAVHLLAPLVALSLAALTSCATVEPTPLAIKGYDPVAYFTLGAPMPGHPEIEYRWDGYRYRFSQVEHRELFKAEPTRYAPQFENFCAMALSKGKLVEADPENWFLSDGKLYVFGKPAGPALFQKDLAGNIMRANQNRVLIPKH